MSNLQALSRTERHVRENWILSHWALGLHMAGPFELLSMRNCRALRSATMPVYPPRASISLTICPLAIPPTAALQHLLAHPVITIETRRTAEPTIAAAMAASQPACPPPTTIIS